MAVLRFSFGTMGSGKSTLALQVHHNMQQSGHSGMLLARLGRDDSHVTSRLGISAPCIEVDEELDLVEFAYKYKAETGSLDYVVCDEAQFFSVEQAEQLGRIVDELDADVFAFGLITDFRGQLFAATARLLELADECVSLQVEARCWCGSRALNNARLVNGGFVRHGDVVAVGDTTSSGAVPLFGDVVSYVLLCRRHFREGKISAEEPA